MTSGRVCTCCWYRGRSLLCTRGRWRVVFGALNAAFVAEDESNQAVYADESLAFVVAVIFEGTAAVKTGATGAEEGQGRQKAPLGKKPVMQVLQVIELSVPRAQEEQPGCMGRKILVG